jgi:antitoxin ParD1/3/4
MGKNTSISLGSHYETFIEKSLAQGRYQNASEIMRAALRLLEEEEKRFTLLSKAIADGVESGIAKDFDPKKHLTALKAARKSNG